MVACDTENCSLSPDKLSEIFSKYDQVSSVYNKPDLTENDFALFRLRNFTLSDLLFEPKNTITHHRIWPYFFWITFVVGLVGNGLVIFVFFRKGPMRTVTNTFLINLAIADVFYLLSTIPNQSVLMEHWPFGEFMCKFISYLMNVTMTVGILTLTAVGLDRHYALLYPISSRKRRTIKRAGVSILTCWIFSSIVNIPIFLITRKIELFDNGICLYVWEKLWAHKAYAASMFGFLYVLPQFILFYCYIRIGHRMWCSLQTDDSETQGYALRKLRTGRRVVRMVIIVTITFVICWLPVHLMELLMAFGEDFSKTFHDFKLLAPLIPHICITTNPFIYNFMSVTFHTHFKEACKCLLICPDVSATIGDLKDGNLCETLEMSLKEVGKDHSLEMMPTDSGQSTLSQMLAQNGGENKAFSEIYE